jgi:putative acetyltransferase
MKSGLTFKTPDDTDYPQIYQLLDRAFAPSVSESELVRNLKSHGKIALDFVIEKDRKLPAYLCYSRAYDEKGAIGYHLAPVAVLPEKQRQGLGKQLIKKSLKKLGKEQPVYVLGDPQYYRKFGFRIDKTQKCVFDPEGNHFMVRFTGPLPPRNVLYEPEFNF